MDILAAIFGGALATSAVVVTYLWGINPIESKSNDGRNKFEPSCAGSTLKGFVNSLPCGQVSY